MSYPTWSDLNSPSIVPPLGARQAPDIGPAALMVSTDPDLRYISSNSGALERRSFFTGSIMTGDGISIAGPYIGAPYAVMLIESLIAKGAGDIIILGWCGAISDTLSPGTYWCRTPPLWTKGHPATMLSSRGIHRQCIPMPPCLNN